MVAIEQHQAPSQYNAMHTYGIFKINESRKWCHERRRRNTLYPLVKCIDLSKSESKEDWKSKLLGERTINPYARVQVEKKKNRIEHNRLNEAKKKRGRMTKYRRKRSKKSKITIHRKVIIKWLFRWSVYGARYLHTRLFSLYKVEDI